MASKAGVDHHDEDNGNDDDDDGSAEGAVFQSLFDDDSSDDGVKSAKDDDGDHMTAQNKTSTATTATTATGIERPAADQFVERTILHVTIKEQQVGGSIAHRLWPSAEALARFVVDYAGRRITRQELLEQVLSQRRQQPKLDALRLQLENALDAVDATLRITPTDVGSDDNTGSTKEEQSASTPTPSGQATRTPIIALELGSGIGLTGLEVSTQMPTRLLQTELQTGLPILQDNIDLNRWRFLLGTDCVEAMRLDWGNESETREALEWIERQQSQTKQPSDDGAAVVLASTLPVLILASDCVYWPELHLPLEQVLMRLLSQCPPQSVCLLAGMRRWKSDNAFYQSLGKQTQTPTHRLQCTCLREHVYREGASHSADDTNGTNDDSVDASAGAKRQAKREIMRIYAIRWVGR